MNLVKKLFKNSLLDTDFLNIILEEEPFKIF